MKLTLLTLILPFLLFADNSLFSPLPQNVPYDKAKMELGKKLFVDPILSRNNTIACITCHDLSNGGDDGLKKSIGIDGKVGKVNAPTVFNAQFNFVQFWDGRAKTLFDQSIHPIVADFEMGSNINELLDKLAQSNYKKLFDAIYVDGITQHNLQDVLFEYGKSLITPNSKFDKYLLGETNILTKKEKEGLELFQDTGCTVCHHGINLGGNLYARFGVIRRTYTDELGKYNVTKNNIDKYVFKVPSLRNVALTSPYFHDGRFQELSEAVKFMAKYQLGKDLSPDKIEKIVAFLNTLNGEVPKYVY